MTETARAVSPSLSEPTESVMPHELLDVIGNRRRCLIIEVVARMDRPQIATAELTERVAERQYGPDYSTADRKRVYVSVYQSHVPRLREFDVLAGELHEIHPGPRFDEAVSLVNAARIEAGEEPIRTRKKRSLAERLLGGFGR